MKIISSTLGAAALLSLLSLAPVVAQDNSSSASSAASSSASSEPSSALSSEPSSAMSSEPVNVNYGTLISSLQAGKSADLTTVTDTTVVNFVKVSEIRANDTTNALDNALTKNEAAVGQLRTDVGGNTILSAKLTAANYTADQVVAVLAESDGSITVVIDDSI